MSKYVFLNRRRLPARGNCLVAVGWKICNGKMEWHHLDSHMIRLEDHLDFRKNLYRCRCLDFIPGSGFISFCNSSWYGVRLETPIFNTEPYCWALKWYLLSSWSVDYRNSHGKFVLACICLKVFGELLAFKIFSNWSIMSLNCPFGSEELFVIWLWGSEASCHLSWIHRNFGPSSKYCSSSCPIFLSSTDS